MDLLKTNLIPKILKTFVLIFLGTMVLTISAKIKIPFYPVPMTMQTFVVLFLGLAFGYKIGLFCIQKLTLKKEQQTSALSSVQGKRVFLF